MPDRLPEAGIHVDTSSQINIPESPLPITDITKDLAVEKLTQLTEVTDIPYFNFVRDFVETTDPVVEAIHGRPEERLAKLQTTTERRALVLPESGRIVPVRYGTWTAAVRFQETEQQEQRKLNEDSFIVRPFGNDRLLLAALDGASSQKSIKGLGDYGIKGSWYVSHIASLGFPNSEAYKALEANPQATAYDVTVAMNTWLRQELGKVEGVDYSDVLTIPGMAGTIALVDYPRRRISTAHVADTIGIAEYLDHHDAFTDNKNEPYDLETFDLLDAICQETGKTRQQIANEVPRDRRINEQLAASFRRKINAKEDPENPGRPGTGILNGMPELVENGLIQSGEIAITDDLRILHLATDGVHMAWTGRVDLTEEEKIRRLLGALDSPHFAPTDPLYQKHTRLILDPEHQAIRRLGSHDDATYVTVDFKGDNIPTTPFRTANQDSLNRDIEEIVRIVRPQTDLVS